jgi:membrane protein implicated in regulation of membrane protease activity
MQWWAWIGAGAVLLGAELTLVDAQFYFVFIGAAALVVGFIDLWLPGMAVWLQWLVFSGLALVSMVSVRSRVYQRMRRTLTPMQAGPAGETITLPQDLPPGDSCRVEYRGSSWSAVNAGHSLLSRGAQARIARVEGLTLVLRGEP